MRGERLTDLHDARCPVMRGADPDLCPCDGDPVDRMQPHPRHPNRTTTMSSELDPDTAATLAKLRDTLAQIKHLTEDAETYKSQLRERLGAGAYTVGGQPALSITPGRKFDAGHAADVLPPDWLAAVQRPMIDASLARDVLPPALYSACQVESGKPSVKPA